MPAELSYLTQLLRDQGPVLLALVVLYLLLHFDIRRTRERLTVGLRQIRGDLKALFKYLEVQGTVLAKAGLIKPDEQVEFIRTFVATHTSDIDRAVKAAEGMTNPLTKEDVSRLRQYTDMLRQGDPFTPEQAQDFHRIAHVLQEERADEPSTAFLLALAAFVLGVYLGPKST